MKYEVITARGLQELEKRVNDKLNNGWRPKGGISAIMDYDKESIIYIQAVIIETSELPE